MPDPFKILLAMVAAMVVAVVTVLLFGCLRSSRPSWTSFSGVLGVALGGLVGIWILDLLPKRTLLEDRDRLLLILFPAFIGVEFLAVWFGKFAWVLRWFVAAAAACILLHNTIYLADIAGPGTREWTDLQAWLILGGLAWSLIFVWTIFGKWTETSPYATGLPPVLFLALMGASVTVMLSGYASAGQLGFPAAAALIGSAFALRMFDPNSNFTGIVGAGLLGLFSLATMGRFFGELTTANAILLFGAPLLAGLLISLPGKVKTRKLCTILMQLVAIIPIAIAVTLAYQEFVAKGAQTGGDSSGYSASDYLNWKPQ